MIDDARLAPATPALETPTAISGNATSIIQLNGASFINIDGAASGSSRDLTIADSSTGNSAAILIASAGIGLGSTNDTIKNCIIANSGNNSGAISLNIGGSTVNSQGADNQKDRYGKLQNNQKAP